MGAQKPGENPGVPSGGHSPGIRALRSGVPKAVVVKLSDLPTMTDREMQRRLDAGEPLPDGIQVVGTCDDCGEILKDGEYVQSEIIVEIGIISRCKSCHRKKGNQWTLPCSVCKQEIEAADLRTCLYCDKPVCDSDACRIKPKTGKYALATCRPCEPRFTLDALESSSSPLIQQPPPEEELDYTHREEDL